MRILHLRTLVLSLGLLAQGASASADDGTSAPELLRTGVALRKAYRDREALASFEWANTLEPTPTARAQMALAQAALADWLPAQENLSSALSASDDPWVSKNRQELEGAMATIERHLGWLELEVDVPTASRTFEGRSIPIRSARVVAGRGVLEVRAAGYVPDVRTVEIPVDDTAHIRLSLIPLSAPPQAGMQNLQSPTAKAVRVEGGSRGAPARPSRTGPFVLGAAGIAMIGVGAYFGVRAYQYKADRDAHCAGLSCGPTGLAADADGRSSAGIATVTIGVGTALVAAATAWFVLSSPNVRALPIAQLRGSGSSPLVEFGHW